MSGTIDLMRPDLRSYKDLRSQKLCKQNQRPMKLRNPKEPNLGARAYVPLCNRISLRAARERERTIRVPTQLSQTVARSLLCPRRNDEDRVSQSVSQSVGERV